MSRESWQSAGSLALGTSIGIVPMLLAYWKPLRHGRAADPFDLAVSYEIWLGGLFCLAAVLSHAVPHRAWSTAAWTGLGLPLSFLLFIAVTPTPMPGLWPLALMVCSIIGFPAAFAGAFAGACASRFTRRPAAVRAC